MPHALSLPQTKKLRALVLLIGLAVLVPLVTFAPRPVASAGGSCTGWTSRTEPPDTIRVGRADGSVDEVGFRKYVGVVMAKEWPGWVPRQAREAGAVAVKQYAWFHSLEGKHRSSYVNAKGVCYDVKDSTADQLYKPEKVSVGDKIWRVVDATWDLSVRKDGKFFMTGYRAGQSSVCASDVDGWKLFAKSIIDCANRGWSRERIQTRYYAPNVTFHWAAEQAVAGSALAAAIDPPIVTLRTGRTLAQKHALVRWDQSGVRPTGTRYQLQRLVSGSWSNVSLPDPTKPRVALSLKRGATHQFRVRLRDSSGNYGPWFKGPRFEARLVQDRNDRMGWSPGDWRRVSTSKASGGTQTYTTRADSQSALAFTGRAVAVVGTMGPNRGRAKIYVDGKLEGEIDLYSSTNRYRVLIFSREWAASERRVIRVDVEGTAGRPRVDVDGVLFYR